MLLNGKQQVRPLNGHVFVRLESLFRNTGNIVIPTRYKTAPHIIGTVEDCQNRPEDIQRLGHRLAVGERVIVSHYGARPIMNGIWDYRIESIFAIVSDDVDLKAISTDIPRCQWCGNAQPTVQQSMLMFDGKCPRCGRNRNGEIVDQPITVPDSLVEEVQDSQQRAWRGLPEEERQRRIEKHYKNN